MNIHATMKNQQCDETSNDPVEEKEKGSSSGNQDPTKVSSIGGLQEARSQDLQHGGVGIQVSPESSGIEKDSGVSSVEDNLKYFMGKHASGSDLPAKDLLLQMELEKLRLQVEETKLKTVQEETQLAKARLSLRELEMNKNSDGSTKTFWKKEIEKFAISRVVLHYNPLQRILWFSILVVFCSMFIYQIILVCDNYFKYPTKIDIQILDEKVPFPAVTFCNLGGVSFYAAAGWLAEGRKNSNMSVTQREHVDDLGKELMSRWSARHTLAGELYPTFRGERVNRFFEKSAIPKEEFFVELRAIIKDKRTDDRMSIDLADLDIQEVDGGLHLKCYTVNVPEQPGDNQTLSLEGTILSGNGMSPDKEDLANREEYFWKYRPFRGTVRMFVHQSGMKINPRSFSGGIAMKHQFIHSDLDHVDVFPGQNAEISVKVRKNIRAAQPYGNCSRSNPFRHNDKIVYRQKECLDMCHNNQIAEQIKSVLMDYPPLDGMACWEDIDEYNKHTYRSVDEYWMMKYAVNLCNFTTKDVDGQSMNITVTPVYGWPVNFSFDYKSCACYPPCSDIEYDLTVNIQKHELADGHHHFEDENDIILQGHRVKTNYSGRFRSGTFKVSKGETIVELKGNDDKFHFIENYIRRDRTSADSDLVSFQINLVDRQVTATIETPLYTPTQFLSEIGGQLELWIGASIITMCEAIELIISFLCQSCRNRKNTDVNGIV